MKPNKFIDRSDFIKPVVVWEYSGSFMSDVKTVDIAHNLPFIPLIMGEYSLNSDFSEARDFRFWLNGEENFFVGALENTVRFGIRIHNSSEPRRVYVRAIGLAPPNYKGDVTPLKRRFLNDSRHRSLKIVNFGEYKKGDTIQHGLRYLPMSYFWLETLIFKSGSSSILNMDKCLRPGSPAGVLGRSEISVSDQNSDRGFYMIFGDSVNDN